jgi:hypothetical protein
VLFPRRIAKGCLLHWLYPVRIFREHADVGGRLVVAMFSAPKQNIHHISFGLGREAWAPQPDPLALTQYSCIAWASYPLYDEQHGCKEDLTHDEPVSAFLKGRFLCWLESHKGFLKHSYYPRSSHRGCDLFYQCR